jgi:hypothetical protein
MIQPCLLGAHGAGASADAAHPPSVYAPPVLLSGGEMVVSVLIAIKIMGP